MSIGPILKRQVPLVVVLALFVIVVAVLWIWALHMKGDDKDRAAVIGAAAALSGAGAAFIGTLYTNIQVSKLNQTNQKADRRFAVYTELTRRMDEFENAELRARRASANQDRVRSDPSAHDVDKRVANDVLLADRMTAGALFNQIRPALGAANDLATDELRVLLATLRTALTDTGSVDTDFSAGPWLAVREQIPRELGFATTQAMELLQ